MALLVGLLATIAVQSSAAAASIPAGTYVRGDHTLYAYVGAGENLDIVYSKTGGAVEMTLTARGPGGEVVSCTVPGAAPAGPVACPQLINLTSSTPGVWSITSDHAAAPGSGFTWDIDVQSGATDRPGRVYAEQYPTYTNTPVDVTLWYQSEEGFLYRGDFLGFHGIDALWGSDAFGNRLAGTCVPAYESIDIAGPSSDLGRVEGPFGSPCGDPYKMFFESPDPLMPDTAVMPDGSTTWLTPPVQLPELSNLQFEQDPSSPRRSGDFTFDSVNFTGAASLQIDANNDGDYTDPEDRIIPIAITDDGAQTVAFDGLDGQGNPISLLDPVGARVLIDRAGEIHFANADVEHRGGGISVTKLNGPDAGTSTLYWNDTDLDIAGRACLTPLTDGRAGFNSSGGVHAWDCSAAPSYGNNNTGTGGSWGDSRIIDDWTYHQVNEFVEIQIVSPADFGDAPDSYGTTIANDGAHHTEYAGLTLGVGFDEEPDGQPTGDATGDGGDEDGVTGPVHVAVGADNTISVTATNNTAEPATLAGWVDLDNSGTFEPGELVSVNVPANSGTAVYPLVFPGATVTGDSFARFRLYSGTPADIVPTGGWASGEVEDYQVHLYSTEIVKETVGDPVANADGTHTVQFRLTVTREGTGPVYDLDDDFAVGEGVTLNSVSSTNTAPGGIATLDEWDAASSTLLIVEDQAIGDGVSHEYLVTVNATVDGEVLTFEGSDCTLGQSESGTGFFNTATVTTGGSEITDEECPEITDPLIEKTVTSGPTPVGGGEYEVVYQIDVTNKHAAATEYDLDDVLQYGEAITLVGQPQASAITGGLSALENQWNAGSTTLRIQTDEPIPAAAGPDSPTVHSYQVTVRVTVDTDEVTFENSDCQLTGGESGTGLMNTAVITVDEQKDRARECPPPPPAIEHDKRVSAGPKPLGGDRYEIEYKVRVLNKSAGPGVYRLDDRLRYGDSVQILSAQLSAPASVTANPDWDGQDNVGVVAGQPIGAATARRPARHVYTITVRYRVDGTEWTRSDGDCRRAGGESGTGTLNTATLRVNGERSVDDACKKVLAPDLEMNKSLVSGTTAAGDVVRFRLKVTNNGPGLAQASLRVRDRLPRGLELKSATGRGWACQADEHTDVVVCVRDRNLAAKKSAPSVMVVAKATKAANSQTVNTACVHGPGDANPDNNCDSADPPPPAPSTGFRHLLFGAS